MIETESRFNTARSMRRDYVLPVAPAMTRCECANLTFEQVARLVREKGMTLAEVTSRTGCGAMCTACLPDLEQYLAKNASTSE